MLSEIRRLVQKRQTSFSCTGKAVLMWSKIFRVDFTRRLRLFNRLPVLARYNPPSGLTRASHSFTFRASVLRSRCSAISAAAIWATTAQDSWSWWIDASWWIDGRWKKWLGAAITEWGSEENPCVPNHHWFRLLYWFPIQKQRYNQFLMIHIDTIYNMPGRVFGIRNQEKQKKQETPRAWIPWNSIIPKIHHAASSGHVRMIVCMFSINVYTFFFM